MVWMSERPDRIFVESAVAFARAEEMNSSQKALLPMGAPRTRRPVVTSSLTGIKVNRF